MAMLADKRERANYVLQPRGKALYEDGNRFGTRMLEKMGWSAGKGLGANENGQKEFVRIKYKNSTTGFGFEDRNDQWTQHEEHFDGLLKTLGDSEQNPTENTVPSVATLGIFSGESLEEKSKKSRARVHYKKFTKGKDLSQYSEKDLANIFGRKTLEKETPPLAFGVHDVDESSNSAGEAGEGKRFGITTISTGTSINDYFKRKMESMKSKTNPAQDANCGDITAEVENEDNIVKKKKKKQKSKELDEREDFTSLSENIQNEEQDNVESNKGLDEECAVSDALESTIKIKKGKRKNETQETSDSQNLEIAKSKKKKKQKAKENDISEDCNGLSEGVQSAKLANDMANGCNTEEKLVSSDSASNSMKRHKRKRCKSETQEPCNPEDLEISRKKKKEKKKKHYEEECSSEINEGNAAENIPTEALMHINDLDLAQSSKNNKRKVESEVAGAEDSSSTTEPCKEVSCDQNKTTKKKKKCKTNNGEAEKEAIETPLKNGIDKNNLDEENKEIDSSKEKEEIPKDDSELNSNIQGNEYKINSFIALKFRNADLNGFPGSNIAAITGYRVPKNLKLIVVERPQDMLNVTKFCYDAIQKSKRKDKKEKEKEAAAVNETSNHEEKAKETEVKKEKKGRKKYSYRQLIDKVKNRNVFDII